MTDVEIAEELPPVAHCTIVYLGPVAPHWEIRGHFGDAKMIDDFWSRVTARLLLLPKHDPQFRRNRERVNRDAERELIRLEWDLGDEEPSRRTSGPAAEAAPAETAPAETAPVEAAPAETAPIEETAPTEEAAPAEAEAAPAEGGSVEESPEA